MKTNKKNIAPQRQLLEKKHSAWILLRDDKKPPSGWIKAIRSALGMNTRQLAKRLGVQQPAITSLENRESQGRITLELLEKAARAMGCKLVYSIVPDKPHADLDAIVTARSKQLAIDIVSDVEHSMRLEAQGTASVENQIEKLAFELKQKMDTRLWEPNSKEKQLGKPK